MMKHIKRVIIFLSLSMLTLPVDAQKGTGGQSGIAREVTDPEISTVSGIIKEIIIGPCENTIGRSYSGSHFIVNIDNQTEFNIHLGPTNEVRFVVQDLHSGQKIICKAFRTSNLPDNNLIAMELETDSKFYLLRDSNLQPIWAGRGR